MASCLDTIIGDDNGFTTRSGRLYLKDVGIPESFITAILNKEDKSTSTFMADRRRLASEYVSRDVLTHFDRNLTGRTFIDADRIGKYPNLESLVNGDPDVLHGMVIEVCTPASNTRLMISKIEFYGETTGDVVVTLYDLRDGTVIATETLDAVAGQVCTLETDIVIQCGRERKRVLIVTDQDVYYTSTLTNGCASCARGQYTNGVLKAQQYTIDPDDKKVAANLLPGQDCGGLSVIASVECDTLGWLCEIKASLALPLLYCLAREIYDMALYNFERYGMQNLRKQDVEKRRDEFEAHYVKSMNDLFNTMPVPNDGLCFVCDHRTTTGIVLP
jgi:hypothetical protein